MSGAADHKNGSKGARLLDAELVADGIHAAYQRWQESKHGSVPFLFNFVDYLTLALPEATEVSLSGCEEVGARWLTTRAERCPEGYPRGLPMEQVSLPKGMLRFAFELPDSDRAGDPIAVLRGVLGSLNQQGRGLREHVLEMLAEGLRKTLTGLARTKAAEAASVRSSEGVRLPQCSVSDDAVVKTLAHAATALAKALTTAGAEVTVIFQFWVGGQRRLAALHQQPTHETNSPPDLSDPPCVWIPEIMAALSTGFTRWRCLSNGKTLLSTPCHFGGVPWVVACREFEDPVCSRWQAYTTYRDALARLNDALRLLGGASIASGMGHFFTQSVSDFLVDARDLSEAADRAWAGFGCVYPIPRPRLRTCLPEDIQAQHRFRLGETMWCIEFSGETSPFLRTEAPRLTDVGEPWGLITAEDLYRDCIGPILSQWQGQMAKRQQDLAHAAYAVGHPLKHRFRALQSSVGAIARLLAQKLPDDRWCNQLAAIVGRQAETCGRVAEMLNFMASVVESQRPEDLQDIEFFDREPYNIGARLPHLVEVCNELQPETRLELAAAALDLGGGMRITPWLATRFGEVRFQDAFYDEVFFEILLNAARHGPRSACCVSVLADETLGYGGKPAIVFGNRVRTPRSLGRLGLEPGQWAHVSRTWQGGLRFIADCLRLTTAGSVEVSISGADKEPQFSVRLTLRGLTV